MKPRSLLSMLTVVALMWIVAAPDVSAQGLVDRRPRDEYRIEPVGVSMDEAVQRAERRFNAKVVKAETVTDGERRYYQIRLLNAEGKVWTVRVDASSGRMY